MEPTRDETPEAKLFSLIADFSHKTVLGWYDNAFNTFRAELMKSPFSKMAIIRFADVYFNACAKYIYTREDAYINDFFDKMALVGKDIQVDREGGCRPYHKFDYLKMAVALSMKLFLEHSIIPCIDPAGDRAASMRNIDKMLLEKVATYSYLADSLNGCDCVEDHTDAGYVNDPGRKIFDFSFIAGDGQGGFNTDAWIDNKFKK